MNSKLIRTNSSISLIKRMLWNLRCSILFRQKIESKVPFDDPLIVENIRQELEACDLNVLDFQINIDDYKRYMEKAQYHSFPHYYDNCTAHAFIEKTVEHYVATQLLGLSKDDVYIDIASSNSPVPEIYHRLYGCRTYRQDLTFPQGVNGDVIGGDASHMPVSDGFATKMALHCAFEHFERNADIYFIQEAGRVLREGGKLCIIPLYLFTEYAIQIDPLALAPFSEKNFDREAMFYCMQDWGERHGRFYDVSHFKSRIVDLSRDFSLTIYLVRNEKDIDVSCYVKFVALFEKKK